MSLASRFVVVVLSWSALVGALLAVAGVAPASLTGVLVLALLLMPSPLVAALVLERGVVRERLRLPRGGLRPVLVHLLAPAAVVVAALGLLAVVVLASAALGGPSSLGRPVTSGADLVAAAGQLLGEDAVAAAGPPPPLPVLLVVAVVGAVVAGWTVNGLFALGEEYGWRGLLWERWRYLGPLRANLLIGLVWGLWHAPVVVQGYDFPGRPVAGALTMVVFCTGASAALTALRELTSSVLPVAAAHGVLNGLAPLALLLVPGASAVVAGPVGLVSAGSFAAVGALLWRLVRRRERQGTGGGSPVGAAGAGAGAAAP
ncbi:CPBP family intramembrane glutamic endopeptidase [Quadrisphaera sp. KR29]|uniref:CPBP family intramembrane glutamic endopeptidase n=1 Tax=Quadrisphaera sp. KR29 TaxID=3461391 RepID=UPI004044A675